MSAAIRKKMEAALRVLLEDLEAEQGPRPEGWVVVRPLWSKYLFLIGARLRLQ